jgi:hypothetical protein
MPAAIAAGIFVFAVGRLVGRFLRRRRKNPQPLMREVNDELKGFGGKETACAGTFLAG